MKIKKIIALTMSFCFGIGLAACSVKAHVHDFTVVEAKAATCTESGNVAYWYCADCGKYFSDEKGENEISSDSLIISATGHDWDDGAVTTVPTCTDEGVLTYTCKVCGETKTESIDALNAEVGHDWVYTYDAGGHSAVCSVCNDVIEYTAHVWDDNVCTVCGYDAGGSKKLAYSLNEDEQSYTVTGIGECKDSYVYIPAVYNGLAVTSIAENAFKKATIKGISIPDSVTLIGNGTNTSDGAFNGCVNLTSIVLPYLGQKAGAEAASQRTLFGFIFGGTSFDAISTKQYYSSAGNTTYYIPRYLTNVTVTGGYIWYGAFWSCSKITTVTLGDDVSGIGMYAFYKCTGLTSIVIGKGVTSIGNYAFDDCSALENVYYTGTEAEWQEVTIGATSNKYLTSAKIYYYSESSPTESGNYWRYDENGEIAVWEQE